MATVEKLEEVIKEYLLFRGFTLSYKALEGDLKNEKDRGYRVDKIMDQIHQFINVHDLSGLKELWSFLDARLFCRLEYSYAAAVKKLENSLFKLYVINCIQSNRQDKMQEFFEKTVSEIQGQHEWREWFVLPYCKCPEEDKAFSMYFSKQWQDTLYLSLQNFLSVIIQAMPTPKVLNQDAEIKKIRKLEDENAKLKQQLTEMAERKEIPSQNPSQSSLSESILSPTGALSGPSAMDLMDDFYVISQDTIIEDTPKPKSQPIKSFLSSIGRSSPGTTRKQLDEKKTLPPPGGKNGSRAMTSSPTSSKKQEPVAYSRTKSEPTKTQAVRSKASPSPTKDVRADRPKSMDVQSLTVNIPAAKVKEKKVEATVVKEIKQPVPASQSGVTAPERGQKSSTLPPSYSSQVHQPKDEKIKTSGKETTVDSKVGQSSGGITSREVEPVATGSCPFLLLSQEEYGEHQSSIAHCKFSGTGHSVATLDVDGVVKVWGLQPSPVTIATVMSKSMLQSLEWAGKSDKWLLLGSKAGSVRLFDVNRKQIEKDAAVESTYPRVTTMSCNPQGTHFVCAASGRKKTSAPEQSVKGGSLTLWDLETMKSQKTLMLSPGPVAVNSVCYDETGQLILTGADDGVVRLYGSETAECPLQWQAHQGEVYTVAFSADSRACFTLGGDGKFIEWSLVKAGQKLSELKVHPGACGPFVLAGAAGYRQVQTPKGKLFAFNTDQQHVVTCTNTGGCIYSIAQSNDEKCMECVMLLGGHKTPVVSVDWSTSPMTMMCLSASMDGKVRVSTLLAH